MELDPDKHAEHRSRLAELGTQLVNIDSLVSLLWEEVEETVLGQSSLQYVPSLSYAENLHLNVLLTQGWNPSASA